MLTLLNLNVAGYIDPSVMTYAIQAIAGVIIAVGAFLGIYLRKAKKKLNNKLGIDENMISLSTNQNNKCISRTPFLYGVFFLICY